MSDSNPNPREPLPIPEAIDAGLAAVDGVVHSFGGGGEVVACRDLGRVFDTAIEHGAVIWNRRSQVGCARVYLHAVNAVRARLGDSSIPRTESVKALLEAIPPIVEQFPEATEANANQLGWTLRFLFDRFHLARGIEAVDELTAVMREAGSADLDLIGLIVKLALTHGNSLYQSEALDACAYLHSHTARQFLALIAEFERISGNLPPLLRQIRRDLGPILTAHPSVTPENAEMLAWKLYETFQKLLKLAETDAGARGKRKYDAFISYRRVGGSDAALAVRAHLQMRGLNAFLDVAGLHSGKFATQLFQEIEGAPSFLLILTPGSLDRRGEETDWFHREIAHAMETDRNIIPILKDGFSFSSGSGLPSELCGLAGLQAVPYAHDWFDAMIDRIVDYMREGS